ncbi:MAG TPA: hypothetical protein VGN22_15295, partial [Pseudonocardia sp.]
GAPFEGFTLRLFDPSAGTWNIWWSSSRNPGHLDPPMVGSFTGDQGVFLADDVVGGYEVTVRFEWLAGKTPRWQQSFSYDAGRTWKVNWLMDFSRHASVPSGI